MPQAFALFADAVLALHVLFVIFVVAGLVLIFVGHLRRWPWVRNSIFRTLHLAAIGVVTMQSWIGLVCPLTTLENYLRRKAGDVSYEGAFIAHWLQQLLYYDAPPWVFTLCYTAFGAIVLASWYWVRPNSIGWKRATDHREA